MKIYFLFFGGMFLGYFLGFSWRNITVKVTKTDKFAAQVLMPITGTLFLILAFK